MVKNYLGRDFNPTLQDFEVWCNLFPPLETGENRKYYQYNDYFLSLECVKKFVNKGRDNTYFLGTTLREYNSTLQDFVYVSSSDEKDIKDTFFKDNINDYIEENKNYLK